MNEADLRRLILCDRKAELLKFPSGPALAVDCSDCMAHLSGWHGMYMTPLRTRHKWATPARGDYGPGWPDLTLVSPRRQLLLFAELKSETGKLRPEQEIVIEQLLRAGLTVYVWRPADLDDGTIWKILNG
jgi:hypothetical protein